MEQNKIVKNTAMVLLLTIGFRILGFLREAVIASTLGNGIESDVYFIAYTTPTLVIEVLAFGAISSVTIPIFSEYIAKGEHGRLTTFFNRIFTGMLLVLIATVILLVCNADFLVKILAPGFQSETYDMARTLLLIMLPGTVAIGLTGLFTSLLNAYDHYFAPPFSNVLFNGSLIVLFLLAGFAGNINYFAVSFLCAALVQIVYQACKARKLCLPYRLDFHLNDRRLLTVIRLLIPVSLTALCVQLNLVLGRSVASGLAGGSISALNYANKIIMLPIGVIVGAICTTIFPPLALYASQGERDKLQKLYSNAIYAVVLVITPVVLFCVFLSVPIIQIVYERGAFTQNDTFLTAAALSCYAPGILSIAVNDVCSRISYAHKKTMLPLVVNLFSILLNVLFVFASGGKNSAVIALCFSASGILGMIFYAIWISRQFHIKCTFLTPSLAMRFGGCAAATGAALYGLGRIYLQVGVPLGFAGRVLLFGGIGVAGLMAYLLALCLAGVVKPGEIRETAARWIGKGRKA